MRMKNSGSFTNHGIVNLKNQDWLDKQRVAGKIAAKTLLLLEQFVKDKTKLSLLELNKIAEEYIINAGGSPTFKGYKGFPAGVCISVNKQLVHGIPTNYVLVDGDVISFDLGVTVEGAIADTAITCIYGEPKSDSHTRLVQATKDALMAGIAAVKVGNQLGCIGAAIYENCRRNKFSLITNYGGHSLDWNTPHSFPFVPNKSSSNEGIRIQPGLTIAIEPMLCLGSDKTRTLDDNWTVVTDDIGAHEEQSIFVHEDHVEIITDRNGL